MLSCSSMLVTGTGGGLAAVATAVQMARQRWRASQQVWCPSKERGRRGTILVRRAELLTVEEARTLVDLCRAGKLYEIERWIASGRSIRTPASVKKGPLRIAIDLGFHSLVELLVRAESCQEAKDEALSDAVSKRRLDIVQLLVTHGAQVKTVPLVNVLLAWDPAIIRFFLENGADVVTGSPFAVAFGEKVRTVLRPYVEHKKAHPELATNLQEQADRALRHFSHAGDLKWISLMMWARANPRTRGPTLDDRYENDPECHTTALQEACYAGNLEVLTKLKPDPNRDDLSELLGCAAVSRSKDLIHYLLGLGANPNAKTNGGSSALDRCLWHLGFDDIDAFRNKRLASRYAVQGTLECIRELVERGAVWRPEDRSEMNSVRQTLYKCEPAVTVDVVKLLAQHRACPEDTLEQLLAPPRMREHLSRLGMKLYAGPGTKIRKPSSDSRWHPT